MSKHNILIYASELSSCIGKNPYKDKLQAIKINYSRNNGQILNEKPMQILEKIDEKMLCQFQDDLTTEQVVDNITNNKNIIDQFDIPENEKIVLNDYMKNLHCTSHGTVQECKINSKQIKKDNIFHKKLLYQDQNYNVFLGGKCDGMVDNTLIEIKTRMYKLFKEIREYEKIQIYSYLYILGVQKGKLIEKYKNEIMEHDITFDMDDFNKIIKEEIPSFLEIYKQI